MNGIRRLGRTLLYTVGMLVALAAGLLEILDDLSKPARRSRRR